MPRKRQPKKERGPRGGGSVYQRKDGRWVAALSLGVGPDGKRKFWRAYAESEAEAVEKRDRAKGELRAGTLRIGEKQTVGAFLTAWLEQYKATTRRPNTVRGYASKIRIHLIPALGHIPLPSLTAQHVQSFVNDSLTKQTRPKKDGGSTHAISPQTVRACYAILHAALESAVRWGLVGRNVAELADPPRATKPEVTPLEQAEAWRLLDALKDDRLEALYTAAMALGIRQGEALGLSWSDVDFERREIRVRNALYRYDKTYVLEDAKSAKSRRTIPLPTYAIAALRSHRERQNAEKARCAGIWGNTWDLVFTTEDGSPLNGSSVTHRFQKHLAKAGLPHQRFHDLRHICASLLIAMGLHPREIMEILGHSQISLTMDTYAHVWRSHLHDAATKMDRWLRTGDHIDGHVGDDGTSLSRANSPNS